MDVGLCTAAALWRFWQVRGHVEEGRLQLERLLKAGSGSAAARAGARLTVARCAWIQGDFETLRQSAEASIPVHRKLGDEYSVAFALTILGAAIDAQGDHEHGKTLLAEARSTARAAGDSWLESMAVAHTGFALLAQADFTAARHALEEALRGMRECRDDRGVGYVLTSLASTARASGDRQRARTRLEEALAVQRALGDVWGMATSLESLASISLDEGDADAARAPLAESLRLAWAAHGRPETAAALASFARLFAATGDRWRAARLYGCASVVAETAAAYPLSGRPGREGDLAAVRASLDEESFAEAWAQGRAMTLDEAVAYALEQKPARHLAHAPGERDA